MKTISPTGDLGKPARFETSIHQSLAMIQKLHIGWIPIPAGGLRMPTTGR